jgi:DNA-binding transcriptional MerR regulator
VREEASVSRGIEARAEDASAADGHPLWTIGAVSRNTGLSPHTIRAWQRRYGFPMPERKPSGHRLYSDSDVKRLRWIVEAIGLGHRAGQVVSLPDERLEKLVRKLRPPSREDREAFDPLARLFELLRGQHAEELSAALLQEASILGPLNFLEQRAIPLTERVGDAWADGTIGVRHEHSFSERLGDVLRTLRLPYEQRAEGPRLLLTTFPGEPHGLGLQMAALVVALAGGRPDVLGTETPLPEIHLSWRTRRHDAIGISISSATGGAASHRELAKLRKGIPASVPIFAGGRGTADTTPVDGVSTITDFGVLYDWVRRASARVRARGTGK